MSPPHVFWNKKTLKHLSFTTAVAAALLGTWAFTLFSVHGGSYAKGYEAGKAEWDEFIDDQAESTEHYVAEGWDGFCSRELYEMEEFYNKQLELSEMCDAEWLRHNARLNAYETLYGIISEEEIDWTYEMINSYVFDEETVP